VVLETLVFPSAEEQARFAAVRGELASTRANWKHRPLEIVGNFVEEGWCAPSVSDAACFGGAVVSDRERGTAWATIGTLYYPQDWPSVFGFQLRIGEMPSSGQWGAAVWLGVDGRTIIGDALSIAFFRFEGDAVTDEIPLGDSLAWTVQESHFTIAAPAPEGASGRVRAETALRRLLESPEVFRTTAHELWNRLQAEVEAGLSTSQKCHDGPYLGDGIPPECTLVPLTPADLAGERDRLLQTMKRRHDLVDSDGDAMYAVLRRLVPAALQ